MFNSVIITRARRNSHSRFSLFALIGLARQRRDLAALDDHILEDIGLTRYEAEQEANRPIWDAPDNWKA